MKKIIFLLTALFSCSLLFPAVEFMGFYADVQEMNVLLSWSTATETENVGFILERKSDSLASWAPLVNYHQDDALLGQGTVSSQTDYLFTDTTVTSGVYYYRISGVDEASTVGLLDSLSIAVNETSIEKILPDEFNLTCYPNPFNPSVSISYQLPAVSRVKASVYDTNGRLVEDLLNSDISAGSHKLTWHANTNSAGVYILKMHVNNLTLSQKLILIK